MVKAIAFGIGILLGTAAATGIVMLSVHNRWDNTAALMAVPFVALLLAAGALIGREAARHGAYRAGYRSGYAAGKRHN